MKNSVINKGFNTLYIWLKYLLYFTEIFTRYSEICIKKAYSTKSNNIVFIDGVRTPFLQSGTHYKNLLAYDLARHSLA